MGRHALSVNVGVPPSSCCHTIQAHSAEAELAKDSRQTVETTRARAKRFMACTLPLTTGHRSAVFIGWRPKLAERKLNYIDRFLGGAVAQADANGFALSHVPAAAEVSRYRSGVANGLAQGQERDD